MNRGVKFKRGQVWVETVIYTLIGLAIIGILLGTTKPKIDEIKDKSLIEQSIESLNLVNEKIIEVTRGVGSRQILGLEVSKGEFIIDGGTDKVAWIMETKYLYSEPGETINVGNIEITTTEKSENLWEIKLESDYSDLFDIQFEEKDTEKRFGESSAQYQISLENLGSNPDTIINFEEI